MCKCLEHRIIYFACNCCIRLLEPLLFSIVMIMTWWEKWRNCFKEGLEMSLHSLSPFFQECCLALLEGNHRIVSEMVNFDTWVNWSANASLSLKLPNKVHVVKVGVGNVFCPLVFLHSTLLTGSYGNKWQYWTKAILWTTGAMVSVTRGCDVSRIRFILWAVFFPVEGLNVKFNLVKNLLYVLL